MSEPPDYYYNTNDESGETLGNSQQQARYQEQVVLAYFRANRGLLFAPHEIPMPAGTPLTSTRRAMTNLTKRGDLEKTHEMRMGTMGHMVHTWRLREDSLETQLQSWLRRPRNPKPSR
jgi:hypothetical protein